MAEGGNFIHVTPFMHVPDIDAALAFFNGILGFKTLFRDGTYAYVHRGKTTATTARRPAIGASAIT
jgi:catechol 2,3-dioxygenase-like lactoylglutathione lyase family enzyme